MARVYKVPIEVPDIKVTSGSPALGKVAVSDATGNLSWATLTKSDVGLSNVDNTSNATERAATATLTNKTLTSPVIDSPTISTIAYLPPFLNVYGSTSGYTLVQPQAVASGTLTLPSATDTLVGKATTDTLTNKRITPRTGTVTSSATPTINTDNTDNYSITALAANITSMTTNLSGTPTEGQKLIIRFKDNGSARTITWGASFVSQGVSLPATTTASKWTTVGLMWNSVTSAWACIASVTEA